MMKKFGIAAALLAGLIAIGYVWHRHNYPYGSSHCCLKVLGLALLSYAETHDGHFPAGAGSPEASLSLLYLNFRRFWELQNPGKMGILETGVQLPDVASKGRVASNSR